MKPNSSSKERIIHSFKTTPTPVGNLTLIATDRGLAAVLWEKDPPQSTRWSSLVSNKNHPVLLAAERELQEYFAGMRTTFSVALDATGTEFQKKVWHALSEIPYGETRSYQDIARRVGNAKSVRAVGGANGKNPISIIVPCHRVIGTSGHLTGFGGGLEIKSQLLALEANR